MRKPRLSRVADPDRTLRQDNLRQGAAHGLRGRFLVYVAPRITRPLPHLLPLEPRLGPVSVPHDFSHLRNPFELTS